MRGFDLRWGFVIVLVVLLLVLDQLRIPPALSAAVGLIAGGYLANIGFQQLRVSGAVAAKPRVTYWRGERIVLDEPRRTSRRLPPWPTLVAGLLYLLFGIITVALVVVQVAFFGV